MNSETPVFVTVHSCFNEESDPDAFRTSVVYDVKVSEGDVLKEVNMIVGDSSGHGELLKEAIDEIDEISTSGTFDTSSELVCDEIAVRSWGDPQDSQGNPGYGETIIGIGYEDERQEISQADQTVLECLGSVAAFVSLDVPMQKLMDDEVIVVSPDDIEEANGKYPVEISQ